MIRIEDSREWVQVQYVVQSKWTPLIDDTDTHDKVRAIFETDRCVGSFGNFSIKMMGSYNEGAGTDAPLLYTYRVIHTMVCHGGVKGLKESLNRLWGTVTAVVKNDLEGQTVKINDLKAFKT